MPLGFEDAVLNLHGPVTYQAAEEFGAALADLRGQLDLGDGPTNALASSGTTVVPWWLSWPRSTTQR